VKRLIALSLVCGALLMPSASFAASNPAGSGQPSQSCGSATAPFAPPGFSSGGFAVAESHYANPSSTGGTASGNSHVVSQYDVACYQYSQSHPNG
jgi:hypothetical protein